MVLQSLCVSSLMEKMATPKGVMAQWRAYSGSSDIQNIMFTYFIVKNKRYSNIEVFKLITIFIKRTFNPFLYVFVHLKYSLMIVLISFSYVNIPRD